ncbi:MAG: AAA family ATPase, partial [Acidimicrobiia bacterium]|nr:AAA family ATPase [Acidimicrobiia bacterium]
MGVRIRLLGELAVDVDGRSRPTTDLARRPRQLMALLALAPGRRLARDVAIEALFGHLDADAGAANLHKAASLVRRHFADRRAVVLDHSMVALWPDADVETDAGAFEVAAEAAIGSGDAETCRRAAAGYAGELLPAERYEPWAGPARERLQRLVADLWRATGDWARLAELDPTDEAAHRELMRSYAAAGRRSAVVRQFGRLRQALAAELGAPPSAETVQLFEDLTRRAPVTAPLTASHPLVGRQVELARLRAAWRQAAEGRGGAVLVRGEAGIGKTRLCEALLAEAAADGWTTLRGSGSRIEAAVPYAPILQAVDRLLRERPDLAERLPSPARAVVERLTAASVRDEARAPLTRQEVVSVVARLLAGAARERGVVLLVDDLHAADDDTVGLVHHLSRAATFQRLLVLAALRAGEESPASAASRVELLDGRRAAEVVLGPLTRGEAAALAEMASPGELSAEATDVLMRRAGGNPFLLWELAAGDPERATSAVAARLGGLEPAVRAALERAALGGDVVRADEMSAFAGVTEEEALRVIDVGADAGLLEEEDGEYRFRHGFVRETLLAGVGAHRRAEGHRAVAAALSGAGAPAARIAHHLLASDRPLDAVPHLRAAALAALSVGAYRDATVFVEQALRTGAPDPPLLALRADVAFATGDPAAPLRFAEAVGAAPEAGKGPLLVRQARAHVAASDPRAAATALAAASHEAPLEAPADRDLATLVEAQVAWMAGDLDACERAVEEARTSALVHGSMEVVFGAMSLRDLVFHQRGRWPDALRRDLLAAAGSPVLASVLHAAHLCGAEAYLYGGRPYDEVKAFAKELAATATGAGATRGAAFAVTLLGEAELLSGELGPAEGHLVAGARLHAEVAAPGGQALALQRLAEVHLARGRRPDAEVALAAALPLARANPPVAWHIVARVYGTMVQAAADVGTGLRIVDEGEVGVASGMAHACPPCSIAFLIPAGLVCAEAGDTERAEGFAARSEPWVEALWAQAGWRAALDELRARIARARGDRNGEPLDGRAGDREHRQRAPAPRRQSPGGKHQ